MGRRVWMAAAEAAPLAQTGGLGEVLRALPEALARKRVAVRRFLPAYAAVDRKGFEPDPHTFSVPLRGGELAVRFLSLREASGVVTTLVACDELYGRPGLYGDGGGDYPDNARRYAFFCRAICELLQREKDRPDVVHAHDWQAALVPFFLSRVYNGTRPPATLFTIHNIAYQGRFDFRDLDELALEPAARRHAAGPEGIEFHGQINFMKAGLLFADRLTTVSPTHARELLTPELGFGLEGVLRARADPIVGILNGADYGRWNPAEDRDIPIHYTAKNLNAGKKAAARLLRHRLGLPVSDRPIAGVVGRLAHQKGIDVLLEALPRILRAGLDLAVLGAGELHLAANLEAYHRQYPERVGVAFRFDEPLSHLIPAASDFMLVPSRYEPCGLTQMHALRYGAVPVVHATGGLADTVKDVGEFPEEGTGFVFRGLTAHAFAEAVLRAARFRRAKPQEWDALRLRGMKAAFPWERAAKQYLEIYRRLRGKNRSSPERSSSSEAA